MAATIIVRGPGTRPPLDSRTAINAAIVISIAIHFAIGWYFVRGLIGDIRLELEPEAIPVEFAPRPVILPPPPPPPPEAITDKVQPPALPPRQPLYQPPVGSTVPPSPLPPGPQVPDPGVTGPAVPPAPPAAPSPTRRVQPTYPGRALDNGITGYATVRILVGAGGAVTAIDLVDEKPRNYGFGKAALNAVARWEFATAQPGHYNVTVRFALSD